MTDNHAGQATFTSKQNYQMFFGFFCETMCLWPIEKTIDEHAAEYHENDNFDKSWSMLMLSFRLTSMLLPIAHKDAMHFLGQYIFTNIQIYQPWEWLPSDGSNLFCIEILQNPMWCGKCVSIPWGKPDISPKGTMTKTTQNNPAIPSVVKTSSFPKRGSQNELQVWLWIKAKNPWKKTVRAYGKGLFFKKM